MLIDFTVENFRSIKDAVTLSAIAQNSRSAKTVTKRRGIKSDNEIAMPFHIEERSFELLPVLGIFGANASGKTNVIDAFIEFLDFITYDFQSSYSRVTLFTPFRLDSTTIDSPTRFQIRVAKDNNIYTYKLTVNRERILNERLDYIPSTSKRASNRLLFDRVWNKDIYEIKNGEDFSNSFIEIQKVLRPDQSFLALLVKSLDIKIIEPFAIWLKGRFVEFGMHHSLKTEVEYAAQIISEFNPDLKKYVEKVLRKFDFGISGFEIMKSKNNSTGKDEYEVSVKHRTDTEDLIWDIENESYGTRQLFVIATKMMDNLLNGSLYVIDEFGSNTHPKITKFIVETFQDRKTNPNGAQLIFASHDSTLQRGNLLRRDQIWFTQKRKDGSTDLYSLSDFRPRNDLAIDKAYLEGRFGGVPVLPEKEELFSFAE